MNTRCCTKIRLRMNTAPVFPTPSTSNHANPFLAKSLAKTYMKSTTLAQLLKARLPKGPKRFEIVQTIQHIPKIELPPGIKHVVHSLASVRRMRLYSVGNVFCLFGPRNVLRSFVVCSVWTSFDADSPLFFCIDKISRPGLGCVSVRQAPNTTLRCLIHLLPIQFRCR
jgi:hypothetical protein